MARVEIDLDEIDFDDVIDHVIGTIESKYQSDSDKKELLRLKDALLKAPIKETLDVGKLSMLDQIKIELFNDNIERFTLEQFEKFI